MIKELSQTPDLDIHSEHLREYVKNSVHHHNESNEVEVNCPWGIEDNFAPGLCVLYIDENNNYGCDYNE